MSKWYNIPRGGKARIHIQCRVDVDALHSTLRLFKNAYPDYNRYIWLDAIYTEIGMFQIAVLPYSSGMPRHITLDDMFILEARDIVTGMIDEL